MPGALLSCRVCLPPASVPLSVCWACIGCVSTGGRRGCIGCVGRVGLAIPNRLLRGVWADLANQLLRGSYRRGQKNAIYLSTNLSAPWEPLVAWGLYHCIYPRLTAL